MTSERSLFLRESFDANEILGPRLRIAVFRGSVAYLEMVPVRERA